MHKLFPCVTIAALFNDFFMITSVIQDKITESITELQIVKNEHAQSFPISFASPYSHFNLSSLLNRIKESLHPGKYMSDCIVNSQLGVF